MGSGTPTAVLQAAVILGSGSASFEMLRHLTTRLPVMVTPKWLDNRIQPIAVADVLHYLVGAADLPPDVNRTFDIGGPEVLTYRAMIQRFAAVAGLRQRRIVSVPVLSPYLASQWVGLVTPVPTGIAKPLVGSLLHEVVCSEHDIDDLVGPPPDGRPVLRRRRGRRHRRRRRAPAPRAGHRRPRPHHRRRPRVGRGVRRDLVVRAPVNPLAELRAFVRAALVDPVPRDHTEPDWAFRRRRVVVVVTLVVGAGVLAWALRIEPGDPTFYVATFALAAVWAAGALLSGPAPPRPRAHPRRSRVEPRGRAVAGAGDAAARPVHGSVPSSSPGSRSCASPCRSCSTTPASGRSPLVTVITMVNGIAEELYFRGAMYAGVGRRHAVAVTTVVYTLVTATSGIPLLALAAAVVGLVVAFQRRVTGGILGPTVTHLTWSLGMLFLLPPVLDRLS